MFVSWLDFGIFIVIRVIIYVWRNGEYSAAVTSIGGGDNNSMPPCTIIHLRNCFVDGHAKIVLLSSVFSIDCRLRTYFIFHFKYQSRGLTGLGVTKFYKFACFSRFRRHWDTLSSYWSSEAIVFVVDIVGIVALLSFIIFTVYTPLQCP